MASRLPFGPLPQPRCLASRPGRSGPTGSRPAPGVTIITGPIAQYFPDLHLPGPPDLSLGDVTWLESAQVGDSKFLPLDDWWTTVELNDGTSTALA